MYIYIYIYMVQHMYIYIYIYIYIYKGYPLSVGVQDSKINLQAQTD